MKTFTALALVNLVSKLEKTKQKAFIFRFIFVFGVSNFIFTFLDNGNIFKYDHTKAESFQNILFLNFTLLESVP